MARLARVVVPGLPHHLTHRGNRQADVFFTDNDRRKYLKWLSDYSDKYELRIWAYCLMTNHVHLLAAPIHPNSLARAIGRTHMQYARWINGKNGWTGHLWANRFFSSVVDTPGIPQVARYIELNPVRAGLARQAKDYRWSSARSHCLEIEDPLLANERLVEAPTGDWPAWLAQGTDSELLDEIRSNTHTGRPIGSDSFVEKLEATLERRLTRRSYIRKAPCPQARLQ